jgi:hypothetical protein
MTELATPHPAHGVDAVALLITGALVLVAAVFGALVGIRVGRRFKKSAANVPKPQAHHLETRFLWRLVGTGTFVLVGALLLAHLTPWLWLAMIGPATSMAILLMVRGLPKGRPPDP